MIDTKTISVSIEFKKEKKTDCNRLMYIANTVVFKNDVGVFLKQSTMTPLDDIRETCLNCGMCDSKTTIADDVKELEKNKKHPTIKNIQDASHYVLTSDEDGKSAKFIRVEIIIDNIPPDHERKHRRSTVKINRLLDI